MTRPQSTSIIPVPLPQDPKLERVYTGHKDVITSVSFKPNMSHLATGSNDNSVMLWSFRPNMRALKYIGHKAPVTCVNFSPNGNLLASASVDKTIRLWTPTVNGEVTVFQAHTSAVRCVQFSVDGYMMLSSSDDKSIKIWSTNKTKFQGTLTGHLNWVRSAQFSPDARLLVSGSDDKTVKLWDLRSRECVRTYVDHTGQVSSVQFHPSSSVIASASADKTIKLYDIRSHALIQHYECAHSSDLPNLKSGGVNSIAFGGKSGEWLISTGVDGLVKIWDIKEGHLFYTVHGHKNGPTTTASFSPEGDFFATCGADSQLMLWKSNLLNSSNSIQTQDAATTREIFGWQDTEIQPEKTEKEAPIIQQPQATVTVAQPTVAVSNAPSAIPPELPTEKSKNDNNVDITEESMKRLLLSSLEKFHGEYSKALHQIASQIDVLTQTMGILESRLTHNEDRVEDVHQKLNIIVSRLARSDSSNDYEAKKV